MSQNVGTVRNEPSAETWLAEARCPVIAEPKPAAASVVALIRKKLRREK
jgi:hypothetical protein